MIRISIKVKSWDPHQSEKQDSDPHQSEKVWKPRGSFWSIGRFKSGKNVSGRFRIRIKLKGTVGYGSASESKAGSGSVSKWKAGSKWCRSRTLVSNPDPGWKILIRSRKEIVDHRDLMGRQPVVRGHTKPCQEPWGRLHSLGSLLSCQVCWTF
jgi:hypothetical protein